MSKEKLHWFAFHMRNINTGKRRIKKVKAVDSTHAFCSDVGAGKEWEWTGTEPWSNVKNRVERDSDPTYYIQY
jgi:hypothetical protein